jgi:DNA polymerase-3 subunit epsilon
MREICLDTETTGLDPKDGHKIIEIACFELINKVKTGKVFHSFVNPLRDVPHEAFRIHGISTEFLKDKPTFDLIADKFLDFIGDDVLVIHNASFDIKFLNFELNILRKKTLEMSRVVDSLMLARKKFPGGQNSLDALCKRFNLDLSKREKHGAMIDTELLCDVYIELMGGAQEGFGFDNIKKNEVHYKQLKNLIYYFNCINWLIIFSQKKNTN